MTCNIRYFPQRYDVVFLLNADSLLKGEVRLPASLEEFVFGHMCGQIGETRPFCTSENFHNILTPSLKRLTLAANCRIELQPGMLPNTLEYLHMAESYITKKSNGVLPTVATN
jgi:hypothetical protein